MAHRKGAPNAGGRKRGTPNEVTVQMRGTFAETAGSRSPRNTPTGSPTNCSTVLCVTIRPQPGVLHRVMRHHTTTTSPPRHDLRKDKEPFARLPVHFDPRSAKIRAQLAHLHLFRVTQSLDIANPAAVAPDADACVWPPQKAAEAQWLAVSPSSRCRSCYNPWRPIRRRRNGRSRQ
jgi:hypothetical protein